MNQATSGQNREDARSEGAAVRLPPLVRADGLEASRTKFGCLPPSRCWLPPKELAVKDDPFLAFVCIDQLEGRIGNATGFCALLGEVGHLIRELSPRPARAEPAPQSPL
jgi:hypothetical protein